MEGNLVIIAAALVGIGIGALGVYLFTRGGNAQKARIEELEGELDSARSELTAYKQEVFTQFSDTAEKFRAMDESYHALHRQLAESSASLVGDQHTLLLSSNVDETKEIGVQSGLTEDGQTEHEQAEGEQTANEPSEKEPSEKEPSEKESSEKELTEEAAKTESLEETNLDAVEQDDPSRAEDDVNAEPDEPPVTLSANEEEILIAQESGGHIKDPDVPLSTAQRTDASASTSARG
ncbi:MAG: DUF1043 family protein [Pseudomonadota bacterium]